MKDGFSEQVTYQDAINLRHSNLPFRQTAMLKTGFAVQSDNADVAPKLQSARAADSDFFAMFNAPFAYGNAWDKKFDAQPVEVVVIGAKLNQELLGVGNNVGKNLFLNQIAYRIVGILKH